MTALVSCSKPTPAAPTSLATMRSRRLRSQLAGGVGQQVVGLGREARRAPGRPACAGPRSARMSGVGSSTISGDAAVLLDLAVGHHLGRKSATAAAITTTSAPAARGTHGRLHLRRRLDPVHARRRRRAGRSTVVTRSTVGAAARRRSSATAWPCLPDERLPMKRTGSIGLAGAAGGDDAPGGRPGRWPAPRQRSAAAATIVGGLGQATGADVAAGEAARRRGRRRARRAARSVATLSCTAGCSHISVCMAGQTSTGRPGHEQGGGEQVVGEARWRRRRAAGRWPGRTTMRSARLAEAGVRARLGLVEQRRPGRLGGQRGEGERRDEALGALGEDGLTCGAGVDRRRQTSIAL